MNYTKFIGFGILIWVVAYLVATLFVAYGAGDTLAAQITIILAVVVAAYVAATQVGEHSVFGMLRYSIGWVVIGLLLDALLTVPFTGWVIFAGWQLWTGYVLVALVPLLAAKQKGVTFGQNR